MTSKCLKSKILRIALCFLLGGALSELNAGSDAMSSSASVKPKQTGDISTSQLNDAAATMDARLAFNRSSERDGASDETIEKQKSARYAEERRQKALSEINSRRASIGRYGGGSNEGILAAYSQSLDRDHKVCLRSLNALDSRVQGLLLNEHNELDAVKNGNTSQYFPDPRKPGKLHEDAEKLAKQASSATGAVFVHISETKNMPLLKAALNSLACNLEAKGEIEKVTVSVKDNPNIKYLFEGEKPTVKKLMEVHAKLVQELHNVTPGEYRAGLLQKQLDEIATLCTSAVSEKVNKLNEYKPKTGESGLDFRDHDNVLINLKELEKQVELEKKHYDASVEEHKIRPIRSTDDIYTYLHQNTGAEYAVLSSEKATDNDKNDASVHMLGTLAQHANFKEFNNFLLTYTHPDQVKHINSMHDANIEFKGANGKVEKKIEAGEIVKYLNGETLDDARITKYLDGKNKNELEKMYKEFAIQKLDSTKAWHLTIPEADRTMCLTEGHNTEPREAANRRVGVQNNKNQATEEK